MSFAQRAAVYGLVAGLALSLFFNFTYYSHTQSLNQQLMYYKGMAEKQANVSVSTGNGAANNSTSNVHLKATTNAVNSKRSIVAVAVKQIPDNNFFQEYKLEGTTMNITVQIRDGEGLILVNTETATGVDFQSSARTAVKVAQGFTHIDLSNKDVIFSISSSKDVSVADGPSAGAVMTVLLISELQNTNFRTDVLMTGTINEDGSIGKIGGIMEKAEAAGMHGAKKFLVPKDQSTVQVKKCDERRSGIAVIVSCRYEPASLYDTVGTKYDMQIIEVTNITEGMDQFRAVEG